MRRILPHFLILGVLLLPATAFGLAFEEHSSWDHDPWLETERGVSMGRSVLEIGTGLRILYSDTFFNSNDKTQPSPAEFDVYTWDLFWRYGFTENWTIFSSMPVVWSEQVNVDRERTADGKLGDSHAGILYQFFRRDDPTLSMAVSIDWKLPTGSEVPGANNKNITGTGTTDIELAYLGRAQLFKYMAIGWSMGYTVRFPGAVQYILDRHTSITNASVDLGDEIHAELDLIGGIEYVAVHLNARFAYRLASKLAIPEYRAETIRWTDPITGAEQSEEYLLFNGAKYQNWDVLSPGGTQVSSAGYIFTLTPRVIIRPLDWFDVSIFARMHLMGKNSIYLMNKDGNNATIDNFHPMQALGTTMKDDRKGVVFGEFGGYLTFRY